MSARVGLLKTSLVDYPGEVAATVFTAGCNLRCPYCHNPELIAFTAPDDFVRLEDALSHLEKRKTVLGGVCITGGEPLLQSWLPDFVSSIRSLGLKVKLDTNGTQPHRLTGLNVDYLAVDLKLALHRYAELGGSPTAQSAIRDTVAWAREYVQTVEYRTTVVPALVSDTDIDGIASILQPGDHLTLAAFRTGKTFDPALSHAEEPTVEFLRSLQRLAESHGILCSMRDHREFVSLKGR